MTWSVGMNVQIIGCEVGSLGEAMRELDTKGMLRGDFILMNFDTISNAKLIPVIMKKHKENCKQDKETAMTVVYKKVMPGQRTGNEILVVTNKQTNRLLFHQRIHATIKEDKFKFPIEIFLDNQEVEIHHDLMDPQISICSPTALPLFSDNFDYETRDQFIRGLVMNQELQAASIYVAQLPNEQYAAKVSDWMAYDMISQDIINRWVYPLVPDMGICQLKQQYLFLKNNIYRNSTVKTERKCVLKNDTVLHENCIIAESVISGSVLGKNCEIGKNCTIENSYIFDNVIIEDDCVIKNSIVGSNVKIHSGCTINEGSVIGNDSIITENQTVSGVLIQSKIPENQDEYSTETYEKLNDYAFRIKEEKPEQHDDSEDDLDDEDNWQNYVKLVPRSPHYESSNYSSRNESEDEDEDAEMPQEDTHVFFTEISELLKRGIDEKADPDFLILEINSSRFANHMMLNEVNFYVIKAVFCLPNVLESPDPLDGFKQVYKYLEKVIKNYIKEEDSEIDCLKKDSAMVDCLNALVECCEESEKCKKHIVKILLFLYNEDILSEDVILSWYEDIETEWIKNSLKKFVEWLEQESEESESE